MILAPTGEEAVSLRRVTVCLDFPSPLFLGCAWGALYAHRDLWDSGHLHLHLHRNAWLSMTLLARHLEAGEYYITSRGNYGRSLHIILLGIFLDGSCQRWALFNARLGKWV